MSRKSISVEKRHRQSEERRLKNKAVRSSVRTSAKKFQTLALKKDTAEAETAGMIKVLSAPISVNGRETSGSTIPESFPNKDRDSIGASPDAVRFRGVRTVVQDVRALIAKRVTMIGAATPIVA